jgi:hypothetical protein
MNLNIDLLLLFQSAYEFFSRMRITTNGSVRITATAKLTGGGANGSMTFTKGILTSSTPAT